MEHPQTGQETHSTSYARSPGFSESAAAEQASNDALFLPLLESEATDSWKVDQETEISASTRKESWKPSKRDDYQEKP